MSRSLVIKCFPALTQTWTRSGEAIRGWTATSTSSRSPCGAPAIKPTPSGSSTRLALSTATWVSEAAGLLRAATPTPRMRCLPGTKTREERLAAAVTRRTRLLWRSSQARARPQEGVFAPAMQVRRLTPTECCRLQGFPDDHCDITFRKKPAADGPKYRALGNSMAVPCMLWLGWRIHKATS